MKRLFIPIILTLFGIILIGGYSFKKNQAEKGAKKQMAKDTSSIKNKGEIYLAGGCFWGVEGYFSKVDGNLHQRLILNQTINLRIISLLPISHG